MDNWDKHDPDMILSYSEFELKKYSDSEFSCNSIYPREDMIQYRNQKSGCIIDMGYYDIEESQSGVWKVIVVSSELDWEAPIRRYRFSDIVGAVKQTKSLIDEFST